jgi:hypothetical protein
VLLDPTIQQLAALQGMNGAGRRGSECRQAEKVTASQDNTGTDVSQFKIPTANAADYKCVSCDYVQRRHVM